MQPFIPHALTPTHVPAYTLTLSCLALQTSEATVAAKPAGAADAPASRTSDALDVRLAAIKAANAARRAEAATGRHDGTRNREVAVAVGGENGEEFVSWVLEGRTANHGEHKEMLVYSDVESLVRVRAHVRAQARVHE